MVDRAKVSAERCLDGMYLITMLLDAAVAV